MVELRSQREKTAKGRGRAGGRERSAEMTNEVRTGGVRRHSVSGVRETKGICCLSEDYPPPSLRRVKTGIQLVELH